jgi:hypothetical protein
MNYLNNTTREFSGSHFMCNDIKHVWKHYDKELLESYSEIKFTEAHRYERKFAIFWVVQSTPFSQYSQEFRTRNETGDSVHT